MALTQHPDDAAVRAGRALQFREGRSIPGTPFIYSDDTWHLGFRETTAGSPSTGQVSFSDFPEVFKDDVKDFIAQAWLGDNLSNTWIRSTLGTLRRLMDALREHHAELPSPLMLTREDARLIEEHVKRLDIIRKRPSIATLAEFAVFLRENHDGQPADFRPNPANVPPTSRSKQTYTEGMERVIPDEVSAAVMWAATYHVRRRDALAHQPNLKPPLHDVLYPSVVQISHPSGRRISEILLLTRKPLREPTEDELVHTGPGVWLLYCDTKLGHGEREAFIPEPLAAIVRDAVTRVATATAHLAEESKQDRLFLTDAVMAGKRRLIRTVSARAYTLWLNGRMTAEGKVERPGFIHRYCVTYRGQYYQIDPHQTRHTLATKAYLGGAEYVDVGDHLGHKRSSTGLTPMTGVYIHGMKKQVETIREMNAQRVLTGKALPVINDKNVMIEGLRPEDMAIWREQGMIAQPTLYGY